MKVSVQGPPLVAEVSKSLLRVRQRMKEQVRAAMDEAAQMILDEGRDDIRGAGKFGSRWTDGLRATVDQQEGRVVITLTEDVPYWKVFQYGATIHGKPLLWIPLSFAPEAQGVSAKDFPGRLFRVDRKSGGAPLLLSAEDKQPKYSGHESVTIPKKFNLLEICREVAGLIGGLYRKNATG